MAKSSRKAGKRAISDGAARQVGDRKVRTFQRRVQRTIDCSSKRAFEAISQATHWNRWFTKQARIDLKVGGRYSNADKDTGVILEVDPPRQLRFSWDNPGHCPGTVVQFIIESKARNKCVVRLTHSKLRSKKDREHMKGGWSWAMDSLKSYLETGKPVPSPD